MRIKVDHEAVFKAADRSKREDLRMGVLLEVDHDAYSRRGVLSGADAADIGVLIFLIHGKGRSIKDL